MITCLQSLLSIQIKQQQTKASQEWMGIIGTGSSLFVDLLAGLGAGVYRGLVRGSPVSGLSAALLLVVRLLEDLLSALYVDMRFETLHDFLPVYGELKLRILLEVSVFFEHACVAGFQFFSVDLEDLLYHRRLTSTLQCVFEHRHLLAQFLHFHPHLSDLIEAETTHEMPLHNPNPLIHSLHQILPHLIDLIERPPPQAIDIDLRRIVPAHQVHHMFQFPVHIDPHLLDAEYLRDHVGLAMQLQVLSYAFRTQQFHAFYAQMPDYLARMRLAVVVLELRGRLSDGAGCGQEGS